MTLKEIIFSEEDIKKLDMKVENIADYKLLSLGKQLYMCKLRITGKEKEYVVCFSYRE